MGVIKELPGEMVRFLRVSNKSLRALQATNSHYRTYMGCMKKVTTINDTQPASPKKWADVFTWMSEVAEQAPGEVEKNMASHTARIAMENLCRHYGVPADAVFQGA